MSSKDFVSRGGEKLQAAINNFQLTIDGLTCLDVGSSTGGFVDCLLKNGVKKVYAVDTCYGELAWTLRNDPRVVVMERTNILHLKSLSETVDLITIDAGWTKLELVLPVVKPFLKPNGYIIALLKPHYEAEKKDLVKGVLSKELSEKIKDETRLKISGASRSALESLYTPLSEAKLKIIGEMESPILGGAGNTEYLLLLKPS